jgi:hypothetical protein
VLNDTTDDSTLLSQTRQSVGDSSASRSGPRTLVARRAISTGSPARARPRTSRCGSVVGARWAGAARIARFHEAVSAAPASKDTRACETYPRGAASDNS